jgi:hypothetical protein
MTEAFELPSGAGETPQNFDRQTAELLEKYSPHHFDARDRDVMAAGLHFLYDRYSVSSSPYHHAYHNHIHTIEMTERELWMLKFFEEKMGWSLQRTDYQAGVFIPVFHDSIVNATSLPPTISVTIGEAEIQLANDGTQSDEQLSAELAIQVLEHYGYTDKELLEYVYDGVLTTEVERTDGIKQVHVDDGDLRPAIIAAKNSDMSAGFAGGPKALIRDISNLAEESLGENTDDIGKITDTVMKLVAYQQKFLEDRVSDLDKSISPRILSEESRLRLHQVIDEELRPYQERAITFARMLDKHSQAIRDMLYTELEKRKEQALAPSKKIRQALTKIVANIPPEDAVSPTPKDT